MFSTITTKRFRTWRKCRLRIFTVAQVEDNSIQMKKDLFRAQLESQAKEIDILKTEINLYKKKGGHIYTKVTTNRRVAHLNDN